MANVLIPLFSMVFGIGIGYSLVVLGQRLTLKTIRNARQNFPDEESIEIEGVTG